MPLETPRTAHFALTPRISYSAQSSRMKFCRFLALDSSKARVPAPVFGLIEEEDVIEISGAPWQGGSRTNRRSRLNDVRLVAPVEPAKIVSVGRNYSAHATELSKPRPKE